MTTWINDTAIRHRAAQTAAHLRISTQAQEANRTDARAALGFDTRQNKGVV